MPVLHSNLETDLREANRLDQALRVTLIDMADIRQVPGAIDFLGTVNGALTDTFRQRYWSGGGSDVFQATGSEDTDVAETPITDTGVNVAVARQSLVRNIGDLAEGTSVPGGMNAETLARDMVFSYGRRFTNLWATALATASTDVGTAAADMIHDDFADALYTIQIANNNGPYFSGLAPRQVADWQESLRGETGALSFRQDTSDMLTAKSQGFVGTMLGVSVWQFSHITDDGTSRQGGLWATGAFGFRIMVANPRPGAGSLVVVRMDELAVEVSRKASRGLTEIVGNAYVGLGVLEQARFVGIVTDA